MTFASLSHPFPMSHRTDTRRANLSSGPSACTVVVPYQILNAPSLEVLPNPAQGIEMRTTSSSFEYSSESRPKVLSIGYGGF